MCGIAGILSSQESKGSLEAMVETMVHRGPDDQGIESFSAGDRWVGLGHRRLSILDLSSAGHQPMIDPETGNIIVFNGEIYNHLEIRKALPAYDYKSNSDTETILRAYSSWKESVLEHLVGMFAFAIWDASEKQLFVARDRLGIKPLYFFSGNGQFIFASEIRSILAGGLVPRNADAEAIDSYLTFGAIQEPKTILRDVHILPPASFINVAADGRVLKSRNYWSLSGCFLRGDQNSRSVNQAAITDAVRESVSARLLSDAPLGAFLSGGIDSSIVVGMMASSGIRPETFCLDFEEGQYREGKYAEIVAGEFGCNHHNIRVQPSEFIDSLDNAFLAMDQPTNDGINTYFVSRVTREGGLKVALSGQGGDEVFAGYPSFRLVPRVTRLGGLPSLIRSFVPRLLTIAGKNTIRAQKISDLVRSGNLSSHNAYAYQRSIFWDDIRKRISTTSAHIPGFEWIERAVPVKELSRCPINQVSQFELSCYMRNTLLRDSDVFSMAHSLEVRVPLIDHRLIELIAGIDGQQKMARRVNKPLLVNTLAGKIPDEVIFRRKGIFWFPWDEWLRRDLRHKLNDVFEGRSDLFEVAGLNQSELRKLWLCYLQGGPSVHWAQIWTIYVLLRWMELNKVAVY